MTETPFREFLFGVGLSEASIRSYTGAVRRAISWCEDRGIDLATANAIELAELNGSVPARWSRRQLRSSLRWWFEWLGRADAPLRAIRVPPKPRMRCRALLEDDARAMVKASLGRYPEGLAVLFGFYLGLRATEISEVRWDRFDTDLAWYTVTGKRDVTATIPVHPVLRYQLEALPGPREGWVFPGSQGREQVASATIWNWTQRIAEAAGVVEHVHPHRLRHTAISTVNDLTGDLRAAQEFARHARPETTAGYTRVTADRLTRAVGSLDYL